ncbi:dienelactone hydrolase family protein [uncultured Nitratireductor sp.]|uniref:dienelactone hydrolase family protein n=1 Tax=uncultured Nitratireductor sp. TaxID=520953 RepID=UPI0025E37CF0|nr:dienelactone hydrolase family protein [uncultured Nitratireductor sp.]
MTSSDTASMHRLTAKDGHELDCWIQPPTAPRRGGLVILQEIFGVTDQLKGVAEKYAAQGLEVAIPALFDRKERSAVVPFDQAPRGRDMMLASDLEETVMDMDAAVQAVTRDGQKTVVIGFCWGGGTVNALAVADPELGAGVAYYGRQPDAGDVAFIEAPLMLHYAGLDERINAGIDAFRAALEENFEAIGTGDFARTDSAFHRVLVSVIGNPVILGLHDMFVSAMLAQRPPTDDPAKHDTVAYEEHRAIYQAIIDGDMITATDVMDRHLARSYRARLKSPRKVSDYFQKEADKTD